MNPLVLVTHLLGIGDVIGADRMSNRSNIPVLQRSQMMTLYFTIYSPYLQHLSLATTRQNQMI